MLKVFSFMLVCTCEHGVLVACPATMANMLRTTFTWQFQQSINQPCCIGPIHTAPTGPSCMVLKTKEQAFKIPHPLSNLWGPDALQASHFMLCAADMIMLHAAATTVAANDASSQRSASTSGLCILSTTWKGEAGEGWAPTH